MNGNGVGNSDGIEKENKTGKHKWKRFLKVREKRFEKTALKSFPARDCFDKGTFLDLHNLPSLSQRGSQLT